MRILVTGASGFLGRAVVESARARGHAVTAMTRSAAGNFGSDVAVVHADLCRAEGLAERLAGHDCVIHCAASMRNDSAEQQRDTIDATRKLVAAMQAAGVRCIVLASSLAVYDHRRCADLLDELAPLESDVAARGPYVAAKLEQERLVRASGFDARILRPGLVHGPGREWFYHLGGVLLGRVWIALSGSARLPLVAVDSCAEAFVRAAELPSGSTTLNVIDAARTTRRDYMRRIARDVRPAPLVLSLPWGALRFAARCANLLGIQAGMLHPARLAARCRPLEYSTALAERTLGSR
jgi:nucleoside-diphosphate-sugar epimerase